MRKKEEKLTITKIEFDKKTNEPIIVEIDPKDKHLKESIEHVKNHPLTKDQSSKSVGKQLVMSRLPGFEEESNIIDKKQRFVTRLLTIIFVVFVLAVLGITFYNDFFASGRPPLSWEDVKEIATTGWIYLLAAFLALGFCYLFKGLKLSIMCKSVTGKFHFKTCFETGVVGHYYNSITPLGAGGQPFEIYHLAKHGVPGGAAASLPIATFFLNQFAFVILSITAYTLFQQNLLDLPDSLLNVFPTTGHVLVIIGLICCLLMPTLVIFFSMLPKLGAKIIRFVMYLGGKLRLVKKPKETTFKTIKSVVMNARCLRKFATKPLAFFPTFLLSFCEWFALCSTAFFTLKLFGYDIPNTPFIMQWLQVVQLCLILYAAISFIPTPGNSGAADGFFYILFSVKLVAGLAFPALVTWRLFSFYSFIIVGFIFTSLKKKADHKRKALSPDIPKE